MCSATAQEPCKLTPIGVEKATTVRNGCTLLLEDGRELRLAAIEAGDASGDALRRLIGGRALRLEQQDRKGEELDRYGRLLAFAYAGDAQQSLQQALLEQGLARVPARRQGLRRGPVNGRTRSPGGAPRIVGRSQFSPFAGGKSRQING
jgi:endonuclease YncB( thermonuclease family)